ncbi:MAG: EamA family transporter [Bacteroidia bacterium]|nr:EamA family transporter [Methylotenera sp.]
MRLPSNLSLHVVCLIALLLLVDTFAQIFFKIGVTQLGEFPMGSFSNILHYSVQLAQNIFVISGVVALIFAFFTWLILISKVDLSFAHPMTSLVYATIPLSASLMLNEPLHWNQMIGISIIVLGVFIVSDEAS